MYSTSNELNLISHVFAIQNLRPVFSTDHMYYNTSKVILFLTYRGITCSSPQKNREVPKSEEIICLIHACKIKSHHPSPVGRHQFTKISQYKGRSGRGGFLGRHVNEIEKDITNVT